MIYSVSLTEFAERQLDEIVKYRKGIGEGLWLQLRLLFMTIEISQSVISIVYKGDSVKMKNGAGKKEAEKVPMFI